MVNCNTVCVGGGLYTPIKIIMYLKDLDKHVNKKKIYHICDSRRYNHTRHVKIDISYLKGGN